MLTDVDKEGAASVTFNDFVEMVTPKVLARDPKVGKGCTRERERESRLPRHAATLTRQRRLSCARLNVSVLSCRVSLFRLNLVFFC